MGHNHSCAGITSHHELYYDERSPSQQPTNEPPPYSSSLDKNGTVPIGVLLTGTQKMQASTSTSSTTSTSTTSTAPVSSLSQLNKNNFSRSALEKDDFRDVSKSTTTTTTTTTVPSSPPVEDHSWRVIRRIEGLITLTSEDFTRRNIDWLSTNILLYESSYLVSFAELLEHVSIVSKIPSFDVNYLSKNSLFSNDTLFVRAYLVPKDHSRLCLSFHWRIYNSEYGTQRNKQYGSMLHQINELPLKDFFNMNTHLVMCPNQSPKPDNLTNSQVNNENRRNNWKGTVMNPLIKEIQYLDEQTTNRKGSMSSYAPDFVLFFIPYQQLCPSHNEYQFRFGQHQTMSRAIKDKIAMYSPYQA
jgi:hypothetical protein